MGAPRLSVYPWDLAILAADCIPPGWLTAPAGEARPPTGPRLVVIGPPVSEARRRRLRAAGVDAYLAGPVEAPDLLAEVRGLLQTAGRKARAAPRSVVVTPAWTLDLAGQRLVGAQGEARLTEREFRLLAYLVRHAGAVLRREALLTAAWGYACDSSTREVDLYVCYLRRKLEPDPAHPRYLLTVWGRGYRYQPPPGAEARMDVGEGP
jgi:two-component system KDP operon response regulator KdpE